MHFAFSLAKNLQYDFMSKVIFESYDKKKPTKKQNKNKAVEVIYKAFASMWHKVE